MVIKLQAARRLSQMSNQEKITHYKKMLQKVKHRLHTLDHDTAPKTTRYYLAWAIRLEKRIQTLQSRHRH